MSLKILTLDSDKEWNEIVKTFRDYDIYYLSGYLKCLKIIGDGEPLLFFYEDENCRGINVVLKRDISLDKNFNDLEKGKYFDLTSPYGYGGWIIEGDNYSKLFLEYEKWCAENNIISEFVRFHPLIGNQAKCENNYNVVALGKVIAMNCGDKELLWSNMSSRNRNRIKKSINSGVVVNCGRIEKLDKFIEIYNETMHRDNATDYYFFDRSYYECIFNELKDNVKIYSADYDNKTVSTTIIFYCNGKASYHLSGSRRNENSLYETQYMLYEIARQANLDGYKSLLLGGGVGSSEDNLYLFKREFDKKNAYQFYIGKKIFNREIYDQLVAKNSNILNHNFFPEYRG